VNVVRLGDVLSIQNGFAFKSTFFNSDGDGLPIVRIRDVVPGKSNTYYSGEYDPTFVVENGELLIGMDGEFNLNYWSGGRSLLNQRVCRVSSNPDLCSLSYIRFRFLPILKKIEDETPFVTVKHLSSSQLEDTEIVLPSLEIQHRIANVLERANRMRRLRQHALEMSDTYLQSVFLEMFGEPTLNSKKFDVIFLEELGDVQGGLQVTHKRDIHPLKIPYLRVANSYRNRLNLTEIKYMGVTEKEFERVRLRQDDILLVEGHGNIDEVGRASVWNNEIEGCGHQNHLIRFRPDRSRVHVKYISHFLNSSAGKRYFRTTSNTTSGLNTTSTGTVKECPVLLPPLELQEKFARIVQTHEHLRAQQLEAHRQAQHLYDTLLHQAFTGQLNTQPEPRALQASLF
jgi:type I restriction enzyme, S subunit